jgi:hypothetical protein
MLQSIGVLTLATISWPPARLNVGRIPGFRANRPQKCRGVEGSCPYFHIQWLQHNTALIGPELLQLQDNLLKGKYILLGL